MKTQRFQFGPFCLDEADHLLTCEGKPLLLPPKAFDTLQYLLENSARLVTREELIKAVWPNSFVEDGSLSVNISLIRRTLGDMADGEPFIETVPRKGYRFRAPVAVMAPVPTIARATPSVTHETGVQTAVLPDRESDFRPVEFAERPAIKAATWRSRLGPTLLAVTLVGLGWLAISRWSARHAAPFSSAKLSRLALQGEVVEAVLSPDARYVAYALNEAGGESLWLRQVATVGEVRIEPAAPVEHLSLTFSPDGNFLYDVRIDEGGARNVYRMPLLGGGATKLLAGITGPLSFSPDGEKFAFIRMDPTHWEADLMAAKADGGDVRMIARRRRPGYFSPEGVAWSRDGRFIFCFTGSAATQDARAFHLARVRVSDGREEPIASKTWGWVGPIAEMPDGRNLLIEASDDSEDGLQVWRVSLASGRVSRVTNDLGRYTTLSLASDGKTLAALQSGRTAELWITPGNDMERATPLRVGTIEGLHGLNWTPDDAIVYAARSNGSLNIFLARTGDHAVTQITSGPANATEPAVTADGHYVLFQSNGKIWRVDRDGTNLRRLTTGAHDVHPVFAPATGMVVYASFENWSPSIGGKPTLWSVPVNGGEPRQLTRLATSLPQVSPDGRYLAAAYFPSGDPRFSQSPIALFQANGGEPVKLFARPAAASDFFRWAPGGEGLDYVVTVSGVSNIWRQPLDGAAPVQLTHFRADKLFDFAWSPDGPEMALARGRVLSDVVLLRDAE